MDGYTFNIKTISARVTKSWKADDYVIVKGSLPSSCDVQHTIKSSSRFTYILARTGCSGPDDIPNVVDLQKQYKLTPLSEFMGKAAKKARASELPTFPYVELDELLFLNHKCSSCMPTSS